MISAEPAALADAASRKIARTRGAHMFPAQDRSKSHRTFRPLVFQAANGSNPRMAMMKKFMAVYLAPVSALEQMAKSTPEQMKAGMDAWMRWAEKNKKALTELGAPLGKTKRVTDRGI